MAHNITPSSFAASSSTPDDDNWVDIDFDESDNIPLREIEDTAANLAGDKSLPYVSELIELAQRLPVRADNRLVWKREIAKVRLYFLYKFDTC